MGSKKERNDIFPLRAAGVWSVNKTRANTPLRHSAADTNRQDFWSERVDSGGQSRQFPRHRIPVEHALGYRPMQLGLSQPKG
jgi:hypothetical protein